MEQHEQYWREQIGLARASGMTMKAWCQQHQLTLGQMKYWVRKLGLSQRKAKSTPTWVEVPVAPSISSALIVEVGHARIAVTDGFDPMLLKQIVQTLEKP